MNVLLKTRRNRSLAETFIGSSSGFAVPRLETSRLWLRPWREDDATAYMRIVGDREVMRHMGSGLRYRMKRSGAAILARVTHLEGRRTIAHLAEHWERWGYGEWAVEEKEGGTLVGRVGLIRQADWEADSSKVEVAWMLARQAWGRGFATEAARASLSYAFDEFGMERIVSITRPANRASLRVMERIGLSFAGRTSWKGEEVVWYAIDRVDFTARRAVSQSGPSPSGRG